MRARHPLGISSDMAPMLDVINAYAPLLAAEAAAEAGSGGLDPADLEQAVWLRLLERGRAPTDSAAWLREAVHREAREARRRARRELPYEPGHLAAGPSVEHQALDAELRRSLRAVIRKLPGRCPQLLSALLSRSDPTYQEISRELGISQGSLGPLRSRCLGCLRARLGSED
ncbi:RNA polymerase sigma factor [Streptomyces sp. RPT161]|uniref:RNA polymerase sigma factor n=1 Tax=Streptomyces sp. RPT161 TaxID=3015993 RepID=UPI003FCCFD37